MFRLLYTDRFQSRLGLVWPRLRSEVNWTVWFPPERVWESVLTKTNIQNFRTFRRCFLHTVSTKCKGRTCDFHLSSHLPPLRPRERGKWRKRERGSRNEAWKSDNLLLCGWFQALVICNLFFLPACIFKQSISQWLFWAAWMVLVLPDIALLLDRWCLQHRAVGFGFGCRHSECLMNRNQSRRRNDHKKQQQWFGANADINTWE